LRIISLTISAFYSALFFPDHYFNWCVFYWSIFLTISVYFSLQSFLQFKNPWREKYLNVPPKKSKMLHRL
jgi:hypothetical protein